MGRWPRVAWGGPYPVVITSSSSALLTTCLLQSGDLDVRRTNDRRPLGELILDELRRAFGRGVRRRNGGIALEELDRGRIGHRLPARLVEPVDHGLWQARRPQDEVERI